MLGAMVNFEGDSDLRGLLGSGLGDGRDWDYTNNASDASGTPISLTEGNDPITALAKFGSRLALFKESSIHLLSYLGGDIVYAKDIPADDIGTRSPRSVVGYRSLLAFQGINNFHLFNGTPSPQEFGSPIWPYYSGMVRTAGTRTWSYYDPFRDCLLFVFQGTDGDDFGTAGKYTEALCYSLQTRAWSVLTFPFSAAGLLNLGADAFTIGDIGWNIGDWTSPIGGESGTGLTLVVGDQSGNLFKLYEPNVVQAAGNDLPLEMETGEWDFGSPDRQKFVSDVWLHLERVSGTAPKVQVGVRDHLGQAVRWTEPFTADENGKVMCLATGKYVRLRITKTDGDMKLIGYTWRVQPRGDY
jgi:hypothetical protein